MTKCTNEYIKINLAARTIVRASVLQNICSIRIKHSTKLWYKYTKVSVTTISSVCPLSSVMFHVVQLLQLRINRMEEVETGSTN